MSIPHWLKRVLIALSIVLPTWSALTTLSLAADITSTEWHGHKVLRLSGEIADGTAAKLAERFADADMLPYGLPVILLDSPGGLVDEALAISSFFDTHPVHAVVPADAKCASACASIVFIAGKARTVEDGGLLGQHSCSKGGVADEDCNEKLSLHAVAHGVSHGSIKAFVTYVPPAGILWFTREDAEGWGLTKYPGEEWSGFEKSEPRVLKMLTGKTPPAQAAWRISFRFDGFQAFARTVSDVERELQLNVFCHEKLRGSLFVSMEINGPATTIKNAILGASVVTDKFQWTDSAPTVWQKDDRVSEVVVEVPKDRIKAFLTKANRLSFGIALKKPYEPMIGYTQLSGSRKVLLFAANNCQRQ